MTTVDDLSATFAALADPTRRAILARLAAGEATVNELAEPFALTLPAVSKHLKVLRAAGLVEQTRQAQRRPCRLRPEPLREAVGWMVQYGAFLGESFDRLDGYLRDLQRQPTSQDLEDPRDLHDQPEGEDSERAKPGGRADDHRRGRQGAAD